MLLKLVGTSIDQKTEAAVNLFSCIIRSEQIPFSDIVHSLEVKAICLKSPVFPVRIIPTPFRSRLTDGQFMQRKFEGGLWEWKWTLFPLAKCFSDILVV